MKHLGVKGRIQLWLLMNSGSQHHLISLSLSFLIRKLRIKFYHVSISSMLKGNHVYECVPELRGMIQVQV